MVAGHMYLCVCLWERECDGENLGTLMHMYFFDRECVFTVELLTAFCSSAVSVVCWLFMFGLFRVKAGATEHS